MPLVTTPTNTAVTTRFTDKAATSEPYDSLAGQWVSDALPAGAVAGTFTLVTGATESTGSRDAFLQCVIRVVSSDGSTVRGTLYAGQAQTVESATSTASNYEFTLFSFKVRVLTASLSSVTAQAGDRVVVEYGSRACNANTYNNSVQVLIGDGTSVSDLPATVDANGSTTDGRPWIEFSQDLFSGGGTTVNGNQATEADEALAGSLSAGSVATGTLATEADTAQAGSLTSGALVDGNQATEANEALAGSVSFAEYVNGTKATETDAASSGTVIAGAVIAGGQSLETDTATSGSVATGDVILGGVATETDVAAPGAVIGPVVHATDITRTGGRDRGGVAVVSWNPAVVPAPASAVVAHRRIRASAFGPVTMNGTQPVYAESSATAPRTRTRILVGGKDVSFYRDIATPEPGYQLTEPLGWGPTTIELPQISACFEEPGVGALKWCAKGKPVKLERVDDEGNIVAVDYRGVVVAHDTSGATLRLEVGGHSQGRAALRHKPEPIFRDTLDLGRLAWAGIRDLGLRFVPRLGPTTGIKSALFGGMTHLDYLSELCAKAWKRNGTQWTLMPDETGLYSFAPKDTTTVHFTVFCDDTRAVADLRSDAAEEPNRIFAGGVTPKGQRVRFGVYPGIKPGPAAPYPFDDDRNFDEGTTDADTDTGDGITVMVRRLWTAGYLSLEEASGEYDADVADALAALQEDAGLTGPVGVMTPALWAALFDLDTTGYTLRGSRIEPAAEAENVRRYDRSASGAILGKNPDFDSKALIVDRQIDFGSGFTRHQMREWARAELDRGQDNQVGTVTINTGAVLEGDVAQGTTVTEADLMDVRAIRPGMNGRIWHGGQGLLMHVSVVDVDPQDSTVAVAKLTVDTQARDAMAVWEVIKRNRETRRDPARRWRGNRASDTVKDSIDFWDEVGGIVSGDRELEAGWNIIEVVAGQEGTVSRLRTVVQSGGDLVIQGHEYAIAVFGKSITAARLDHLIPAPLTTVGTKAWETQAVRSVLDNKWQVFSAGTVDEPCGYGAGRKTDDDTLTGLHVDDAGFSYRTDREPLLYLAVWVGEPATLLGGRVMWNQLEAGA
jgi:hypothetical protein